MLSGSIKRNVPQSNFTEPNNSNVITGRVFGNLYEDRNAAVIRGEVSDMLSVLLCVLRKFVTFLPEKQLISKKL